MYDLQYSVAMALFNLFDIIRSSLSLLTAEIFGHVFSLKHYHGFDLAVTDCT